jgi:hypothetical protein
MQLTCKKTQARYLGDVQDFIFSYINLQFINNNFTPAAFWEKALAPLRKSLHQDSIVWRVDQLDRAGYASEALDDFFSFFDDQEQRLILLLDEFDVLLSHPNFQEFSFYATLRAVTACGSCSLILATRDSLAGLQQRIHRLPFSGGSPILNYMMELRLRPFDNKNIEAILDRAGDTFSSQDKLCIRFFAGCQPYLVQAMAAILWETDEKSRHKHAAERFCNLTTHHFNELWHTLQDRERAILVVLGLVECGKCRLGDKFNYDGIRGLDTLGARLRDLHNLGIADHISEDQRAGGSYLIWQGEQWTLRSRVLVCWVYEVAVAQTHQFAAYDEWLERKGYVSLLNPDQWKLLVDAVHSSVGARPCDIGEVIENKFVELDNAESQNDTAG